MEQDVYFKRNLIKGVSEIINKHGWIPKFTDPENRILKLETTGSIGNEDTNTSYQIQMSLILLRCKWQDAYLVMKFETWADRTKNLPTNPNIVRGIDVFSYYGYHFAKPDDDKKNLPKNVISITCPSDVEELFRKHNHVSQMYKAERLFFALGQ